MAYKSDVKITFDDLAPHYQLEGSRTLYVDVTIVNCRSKSHRGGSSVCPKNHELLGPRNILARRNALTQAIVFKQNKYNRDTCPILYEANTDFVVVASDWQGFLTKDSLGAFQWLYDMSGLLTDMNAQIEKWKAAMAFIPLRKISAAADLLLT